MNWFDTAGLASFAKTALTTAQKTLDKALDIPEERENKREKLSKIPEIDNFFETYGLSDQPSTSQSEVQQTVVQNVQPELENLPPSVSSQGSNFWVDTWGSFFELKGQSANTPNLDPNKDVKSDCDESKSPCKIENTVLSQPVRASLFPSESAITAEQNSKCEDYLNDSPKQHDLDENALAEKKEESLVLQKESEEATVSLSISKSSDGKQSVNDDFSKKEEKLSVDVSVVENKTDVSNSDIEVDNCDKNISVESSSTVIDESSANVSSLSPDSCVNEKEVINKSADLAVHIPNDSLNSARKAESEYDVIEMSDGDVSSNVMENSSDSFTRSASVEVVTSMSLCNPYDNSNSTIVIPDLAENIVWDWSAMENITPDLSTVEMENKISHLHEDNDNQSFQMMASDSSFHAIASSSFPDSTTWTKNEKSSHFTDEFPSSSNEERHSHHTDGSSNSSKDDDDTDTAEVKEYDTKSLSSCGSHATSSSSYVKCSVDDNDNGSHRGPSPTSTTASERSDVVKQESEQNTSGDENETATSSDIEILSPPNGENGDRHTSPLKHIWLSRPIRLRRSESPTSDSGKDSLMPVNESEESNVSAENKSVATDYSKESSVYQKVFGDEDIQKMLQRQEELQAVLEAREKKILDFSKENIELQENEQRLKSLVQKMRLEQAKESRDIAALTKEFTQRLSQVEGQLKETTKERDHLQIELDQAKEEVAKRVCASDIEETIKEKDVQIKELIEEGQKLSKKELHHTTIIKKLRAKEEETNKAMKSQFEKLEENSKEVDRLRKSIAAKEEQETKHIDAIRQLTNTVKKLEKEVASLKSNLEDSTERELSLKLSLDSTYKDLTELRKSYSIKEKELEDFKSGLEIEANENLRQMLDKAQKDAEKEKEMFLMQIQELRCTVTRSEEEANKMEKMYKADIASLQKRLQEAEERNEDLTKNVSSATRPLVRQIENLQASYTAQTISWEKIEKNLTDRLNDAQNQLALVSEKERSITEKYMEYQSKFIALETQNSSLRQEKIQICTEIESLKAKIIMMEENKSRESYTSEKLKENFNLEIQKLKKEKAELEKTMSTCLEQLDLEKKRVSKLEDEIKFKDARALIMSNTSRSSSPTNSVHSFVSSIHNWSQDDIPDHGVSVPINSHRMSVYDSLRLGSGSSMLENLQSQLKQREGEIVQLQAEITKLEQVKESMTRELVLLSEQNETYETNLSKLESVEKEFKELDQKYNTLLQMYGEKVEETEELQLDLSDVKSMYKAQIEELLRNK